VNAILSNPLTKVVAAIVTVFVVGLVLYLGAVGSVYLLAAILKLISGNA
jgi:hypothetical protein